MVKNNNMSKNIFSALAGSIPLLVDY